MDVQQIRRANLVALFKAFVEAHLNEDENASISGLDRAFASKIEVHNTAFSGLKGGGRQISPAMARQIESKLKKPSGWMDVDHGGSPVTEERAEQAFLKLARRFYKRATPEQLEEITVALRSAIKKPA